MLDSVSSLTGPSDTLIRHVKDQHPGVGNAEPTTSEALSGAVIFDHRNADRTQTGEHGQQRLPDTSAAVMAPATAEAPITSTEPYDTQLDRPDGQSFIPQNVLPWNEDPNLTQDLLLNGNSPSTGAESWFFFDDLNDSLLQDWPFVLDNYNGPLIPTVNEPNVEGHVVDLQQSWYTCLDLETTLTSRNTTPAPEHNNEVDDNYRQSLSRRLRIQPMEQNLPPADYLNLCVRAYFKRFHPIFPIIHAPTFRPSKPNSVLLLSICSIGSLFTGYPNAVARGAQLFERLNKAVMSHWETLMSSGPEAQFAMIQSAIIGQTFGLLSGQPKHLLMVDSFHGTVVAWARRIKAFQKWHVDTSHHELETRWRRWAQVEQTIRAALALRIHDAEIANMLHHETFLSLKLKDMPTAASDAAFSAPTATEWAAIYTDISLDHITPLSDRSPSHSDNLPAFLHTRLTSIPTDHYFTLSSVLSDAASSILNTEPSHRFIPSYTTPFHHTLTTFYRTHLLVPSSSTTSSTTLLPSLRIQWHHLFLLLHADADLLEKSIGRDGPHLASSDFTHIRDWANSPGATRCVVHALMIKKTLETFAVATEPAIHVPRAMFFSAICLFCYAKYSDSGGEGNVHQQQRQQLRFPEFEMLDTDPSVLVREVSRHERGHEVRYSHVCGFIDLLRRIGHFGISGKFVSILSVLVGAEMGDGR